MFLVDSGTSCLLTILGLIIFVVLLMWSDSAAAEKRLTKYYRRF
jgi:hypothetical protein